MHGLNDLEIGLMFWATSNPEQTIKSVKDLGLRAGQLGFPGELNLDGAAAKWRKALSAEQFTAITAVCSYVGEDYADIPAVARTVGLVPPATRAERMARTKQVSDTARELDIQSVACHIGFISHDFGSKDYSAMCEVARDLCDYCQKNEQTFTLETGQEPAKVLLQFISDVGRSNLKINFDPANMILYGTGDPIEALGVLGKHVISVHCKDGDWPPVTQPEALGIEKPLGEGSVDFPAFIAKLKEIGYRGVLSIEREEKDEARRTADIRKAVKLLKTLATPAAAAGRFDS